MEIAAPACAAQDFDGEIVALNMSNGIYCSFRDLGAVLWRDLAAGHSVEALTALAAQALSGAQAVQDFVARVIAEGLMRPATNAVSPQEPPQIATALAAGVTPALTLEVYEDMKNLLLFDPVHEVDEVKGWPALPQDV
ncbi:MAG TPA: hypothetical protein VG742_19295 [Dongiaceae bacterium]|nr:hypothetical protein [Dongiaceae bacterium]